MKKIAILILVMALLCASALASVVTTGSVNLRDEPSLDGEVVASVSSGTYLEYMGGYSIDARGVSWYAVLYDGDECWVSEKYAYLTEDSTVYDDDWYDYDDDDDDGWYDYDSDSYDDWYDYDDDGDDDWYDSDDDLALEFDENGSIAMENYYLKDLLSVAYLLNLPNYRFCISEAPNEYYDDYITISGNNLVECMTITGDAYGIYGATVGMYIDDAVDALEENGLYLTLTSFNVYQFEHCASIESMYIVDGFDSCVNVYFDDSGKVTALDWSSYTG